MNTTIVVSLIAWAHVWWPVLLALMPSIVTGLASIPRTEGWVPSLLMILRVVSILVHKDEQGTFKLPLSLAAPIPASFPEAPARERKATLPVPVLPPPVPPGASVLLALALGLLGGCAGWTPAQKAALVGGLLDCTVGNLAQSAVNVLPAVSTVLKGGTVNWSDQLESLGVGFGINAVACAAKQVMASLTPSPTALRASPAFIVASQASRLRAETFLRRHGMDPAKMKPPLPISVE